jgi:nucleotide-binding universal stress UspA family protein
MSINTEAVVVGVDGSTASKGAARWAAAVAEKFGAPLRSSTGATPPAVH